MEFRQEHASMCEVCTSRDGGLEHYCDACLRPKTNADGILESDPGMLLWGGCDFHDESAPSYTMCDACATLVYRMHCDGESGLDVIAKTLTHVRRVALHLARYF